MNAHLAAAVDRIAAILATRLGAGASEDAINDALDADLGALLLSEYGDCDWHECILDVAGDAIMARLKS